MFFVLVKAIGPALHVRMHSENLPVKKTAAATVPSLPDNV